MKSEMKTEAEITERLNQLRERLKSATAKRKALPRGGAGLGIKNKRLLEGEITGLCWVLGVPDIPGPTPTTW